MEWENVRLTKQWMAKVDYLDVTIRHKHWQPLSLILHQQLLKPKYPTMVKPVWTNTVYSTIYQHSSQSTPHLTIIMFKGPTKPSSPSSSLECFKLRSHYIHSVWPTGEISAQNSSQVQTSECWHYSRRRLVQPTHFHLSALDCWTIQCNCWVAIKDRPQICNFTTKLANQWTTNKK